MVVAVTGYAALLTTLAPASGAGPLSGRLVRVAVRWRPHRRRGGLLPPGTGLLLATVMTWVGLLWLGWTLALGAGAGSVVSSTTGAPANLRSRFYFAGFTVLTLGIGDYVPSGAWTQVGTVAAAFSGLFVVAMAVLMDAVESELQRVPAAGPGATVLGAALDVYVDTVRHAGSAGDAGGSRRARMASIVATAGQQWPSRSAPDS